MAGDYINSNSAKYLLVSDVHDTPEFFKGEFYLNKHRAYAKLAKEKGADFIVVNGDSFDEDDKIKEIIEKYDDLFQEHTSGFIENLDDGEKEVFETGLEIEQFGGRMKAQFYLLQAKENNQADKAELVELENLLKKYDSFDDVFRDKVYSKIQTYENKIKESYKEDIEKDMKEVENYYRNLYLPALEDAYKGFNGDVLFVQGNHDPSVIREIDGKGNIKFIDQADCPYVNGPVKIAAASNVEKENLFPWIGFDRHTITPWIKSKKNNKLYGKYEFDKDESDLEEAMNFSEKDMEIIESYPEEKREEIKEQIARYKQEQIIRDSPVYKRLSDPKFDDVNTFISHGGVMLNKGELRSHIIKDKDKKNPIFDEHGNYKFDKLLSSSGSGLEQFIQKQLHEDKLKFVFSGHIHDRVDPHSYKVKISKDQSRELTVGRTSDKECFFIDVKKSEDGELDSSYDVFGFK